jgi:hypothetical protein
MHDYDPEEIEKFTSWVIQYDEFATTEDAAECLGVSPGTLARWRKTAKGPRFVRFGDRGIGYRWIELLKFAPVENTATMLGRLTGCGAGPMDTRKA